MTHCVRWGPLTPSGEREIWGSNCQPKIQLQVAAATWRIQSRNWMDSDSAFYLNILVLVRAVHDLWLWCRKTKLAELTGWSLSDECFTASTTYKDCVRRFCEIFGNSAGEAQATDVTVCPRCSTSLCTCSRSGGTDLNEELIVFDFGSKTTWFKYTGDAGIGQLSMHPTIQVLCLFLSLCAFHASSQLSLAIPPWVGAMSTSESCDVIRHIVRCTSHISDVIHGLAV